MSVRVRSVMWSVASLATAGCFLVGNYEVSEHIDLTEPTTTDDDAETTNAVEPGVSPSPTSEGVPDAGAVTTETATGETTTATSSVGTQVTSTADQTPSSSAPESWVTSSASTSSAQTSITSSTQESGQDSSSDETADAGVTPDAASTVAPECPADTTYDVSLELCVYACVDGDLSPEGRCYWIGSTDMRMPWSDVPDLCTERGAGWNVLTIRDEAEHTFVTGLLEEDTWIGASDAAQLNRWVWLDDGTAFWQGQANGQVLNGQFEIWGNGEPSAANDEECARYHGSGTNWTWSDCSCGPTGGSSWAGGGGNWGGIGDDAADVYLPACKGPAQLAPL